MSARYFKSLKMVREPKAGFTLVEVMIAGAVGMTMVFGIMQAINMAQKQSQKNTQRGDWHSLISFLKFVYSDPLQCKAMFKGIEFPDTAGKASLDNLYMYPNPSDLSRKTPLLSKSNSINNFKAETIELRKMGNSSPSGAFKQYQVSLYLKATLENVPDPRATSRASSNLFSGIPDVTTGSGTSSSSGTPPPDVITFWLYTKLDTVSNKEKIDSCSTSGTGSVADLCTSLDGSTYVSSVSGKCVINSLNLNSEILQDASGTILRESSLVFGKRDSTHDSYDMAYSFKIKSSDNADLIKLAKWTRSSNPSYSLQRDGVIQGRTSFSDHATCCAANSPECTYLNSDCGTRGVVGSINPFYTLDVQGEVRIKDGAAGKSSLEIYGTGKGNVPHGCYTQTVSGALGTDNGQGTIARCNDGDIVMSGGVSCNGAEGRYVIFRSEPVFIPNGTIPSNGSKYGRVNAQWLLDGISNSANAWYGTCVDPSAPRKWDREANRTYAICCRR